MTPLTKTSTSAIAVALFVAGLVPLRAVQASQPEAEPKARGELKALVMDDLTADHRKDYAADPTVSWEPGRLRVGRYGKFELKADGSPVGRVRFACKVPPWSPPPPPSGASPSGTSFEPEVGLTLVLGVPGQPPVGVVWSSQGVVSDSPGLTVLQDPLGRPVQKVRHKVDLPPNFLDGEWTIAWDHGLVAIEKEGRTWLEVDIPQDLPEGPISVGFVGAERELTFGRLELHTLPTRPIDEALRSALAKDAEAADEIRRLAGSGQPAGALAKARERVRRLDEANAAGARPLTLSAAWRDLAEAALLARHETEVGPAVGSALVAMRSECGPGHPRTQELFEAVERVVQALAARSAREPNAAGPRTELADLANRLEHWPGVEHWLARAPGRRPTSSGESQRGPTMRAGDGPPPSAPGRRPAPWCEKGSSTML